MKLQSSKIELIIQYLKGEGKMEKDKITSLIGNLAARNIEGYHFETFEGAKLGVMETIPVDSSVSIGNSVTLKNMNVSNELNKCS